MILETLNQHQQTVPPAVQKAAALDDKVGEILNRKKVNDHDKAKLYSDVLQKYLRAKEQVTPAENISPVVTQTVSMYSDKSILDKTKNYTGKTTNECRIKIWKSDSKIADLINNQIRSRKTFNP